MFSDSFSQASDRARIVRDAARREHVPQRRFGGMSRTVWVWIGDIIITVSLVLGLFVFWQVSWSNVQSNQAQSAVSDDLRSKWDKAPASVGEMALGDDVGDADTGEGIGYLYIPRLGDNWSRAIVNGVDQESLSTGPGFYPDSQQPGRMGNTAIAGHRDGNGAPFHDLDTLETCDSIVIETKQRWLTYRVLPVNASGNTYIPQLSDCVPPQIASVMGRAEYQSTPGRRIVSPSEVGVVRPVPLRGDIDASQAQASMVTLTTCHPVWSNKQRMVIHAVLVENTLKSAHEAGWKPEAAIHV